MDNIKISGRYQNACRGHEKGYGFVCLNSDTISFFDNQFDPLTDTRFEADGIAIVTRKKFAEFLDGTVIDFKQTDTAAGFSIENPNFPAGAGCAGCAGH